MKKFTNLEKQVLRNFITTQNIYDFGEAPQKINYLCSLIFDNEGDFIMPETIKGVVGSLVKKSILHSEDHEENGEGSFIYFHNDFYENETLLNELNEAIKINH